MPADPTEDARRAMIAAGIKPLNDESPTWTTEQLQADFEVVGFSAPFVVVRRRSDNVLGSLEFTHSPRMYFNFEASDRKDR